VKLPADRQCAGWQWRRRSSASPAQFDRRPQRKCRFAWPFVSLDNLSDKAEIGLFADFYLPFAKFPRFFTNYEVKEALPATLGATQELLKYFSTTFPDNEFVVGSN